MHEPEPARSAATHFFHPIGAAVDSSGDVYVADEGGEAIYEFNAAGEEVEGPITGSFGSPGYLAVDASGDLFVIDTERKVFELKHGSGGGFEPALELVGGASAYGVVVDPVHNVLYLDFGSYISEYSLAGGEVALRSEFGAEQAWRSRALDSV